MIDKDILDAVALLPKSIGQNLGRVLSRFTGALADKILLSSELRADAKKHDAELQKRLSTMLMERVPEYLDKNPQLADRALAFIVNDAVRSQVNREAILRQSIPFITDSDNEGSVDDISEDWLTHFFQLAGEVSDERMQLVWAKILANEIRQAGTFSRKTLQIVRLLEPDEANNFTAFCGVCISSPNGIAHIYFESEEGFYLDKIGLNLELLHDLSVLGLLPQVTDTRIIISDSYKLNYFHKEVTIVPPPGSTIPLSALQLSKFGAQLFPI